jgi:hypothetical protein
MMELNVIVEFKCCVCGRELNVELKCAGKGLAAGIDTVAAVHIECPKCESTNQLYFEPCGRVRAVFPLSPALKRLQPSLN